jgi:hypothetical protein
MQLRLAVLASILVACGACGDDGDTCDPAPIVNIDNGSCGDQLRFTGEYVDWDNDTAFCGINEALFQVQGDGAMDTTAPNGRVDQLCISGTDPVTLIDVTPATAESECTTPPSTYSLAGIAVANAAMLRAGGFWSARNFTVARQATIGFTPDPGKAHVFVHVDGDPRTVAITAGHDAAQAIVENDWEAGDTGHEVFFPNVDIGGGTTEVSTIGGCAAGTGEVPLAANKITYVSLKAL